MKSVEIPRKMLKKDEKLKVRKVSFALGTVVSILNFEKSDFRLICISKKQMSRDLCLRRYPHGVYYK